VNLSEPLNELASQADREPWDDYSKDSLAKLFGVQEIYPEEHGAAKDSPALQDFLLKYKSVENLCQGLNTSLERGISGSDLQARIEKYGNNKPVEKSLRTVWDMVKECLSDTILIILMVATAISLPCGYYQSGPVGMVDGFSIFIAIIIIVCITVGNELVKQKQFQELEAKSDSAETIVLRNGIKETIDSSDLVVGDVVYLELGKAVPADCIVFQSSDLFINETAMTGEAETREKKPINDETRELHPCPFALKSTLIEQGNGKAVVCAVGPNTQIGKTEMMLMADQDDTPL